MCMYSFCISAEKSTTYTKDDGILLVQCDKTYYVNIPIVEMSAQKTRVHDGVVFLTLSIRLQPQNIDAQI